MKPYTVYINGKFVCEKDATVLFNDTDAGVELFIESVVNDNVVTVSSKDKPAAVFESDLDIVDIQFFIKTRKFNIARNFENHIVIFLSLFLMT